MLHFFETGNAPSIKRHESGVGFIHKFFKTGSGNSNPKPFGWVENFDSRIIILFSNALHHKKHKDTETIFKKNHPLMTGNNCFYEGSICQAPFFTFRESSDSIPCTMERWMFSVREWAFRIARRSTGSIHRGALLRNFNFQYNGLMLWKLRRCLYWLAGSSWIAWFKAIYQLLSVPALWPVT